LAVGAGLVASITSHWRKDLSRHARKSFSRHRTQGEFKLEEDFLLKLHTCKHQMTAFSKNEGYFTEYRLQMTVGSKDVEAVAR
jgi:hypothetical protein